MTQLNEQESREELTPFSFLVDAYFAPEKHEDIARLVDISEIRENLHNLSIPLYTHNGSSYEGQDLEAVYSPDHCFCV